MFKINLIPFNKLLIENKKESFYSIKFNKLIGQGVNENKQYIDYDISNYKSSCFDEIYLYNSVNLTKLAKYIINNPNNRYLASGDTNQLK
jgi:hypothetical protein